MKSATKGGGSQLIYDFFDKAGMGGVARGFVSSFLKGGSSIF